jgi:hypothetical protein
MDDPNSFIDSIHLSQWTQILRETYYRSWSWWRIVDSGHHQTEAKEEDILPKIRMFFLLSQYVIL